ncbi:MAG: hypothetical protein ACXVP2_09750 [Tumebacillaceae bacterium]
MYETNLATLDQTGRASGYFVPIALGLLKDTTCPHLMIEVYDFDEVVKTVYRREGLGGEIPKSFDCLKFSSDYQRVYFVEMKRFREMREKFLSTKSRDRHLPLVNKQINKYAVEIPGKVKGTQAAFKLLHDQLGITIDQTHEKKFIVITDVSMKKSDDYVDLTLYTLNYLANEETPLDYFVQLKMSGMLDNSFAGDVKPILVSCATLEKHIGE